MVSPELLNIAVERLVERFHPRRIILFGSQARGMADRRSDVDLLVIDDVSGDRRERMLQMDRALSGLGLARDIVLMSEDEFERDRCIPGTLARPAAQEGRVLYDIAARGNSQASA